MFPLIHAWFTGRDFAKASQGERPPFPREKCLASCRLEHIFDGKTAFHGLHRKTEKRQLILVFCGMEDYCLARKQRDGLSTLLI
mmetsp:Transcript_19340/g.53136  ORF Transcript_19340/g.53136 Transcript_19340/m.53136 type:complete len:84 (-) Transcript_19340:729-980(-)